MIEENEYLNWIEGKKLVNVNAGGQDDFSLMEKYGVPDMQFGVMLFYAPTALRKLSDVYTNEDSEYNGKFYAENASSLEEYIVIGSYLGSQICIDRSGKVYRIDNRDFSRTFVNHSFDDFIGFFMLIDRELGHVNKRVILSITKEQVEKIREKLEKRYEVNWPEYVFWDKLTRGFTSEIIEEKPKPVPKVEDLKPSEAPSGTQTIVVVLDSKKMSNPDLDIVYSLPERVDEYTGGEVKDDGYEYLSDTLIGIWMETKDAAGNFGRIIQLMKEEKFFDNDLSKIAEIYISEESKADIKVCRKVFPTKE